MLTIGKYTGMFPNNGTPNPVESVDPATAQIALALSAPLAEIHANKQTLSGPRVGAPDAPAANLPETYSVN